MLTFFCNSVGFSPSGPRHIMKKTDTCYYMSITKEENSAFVVANHQTATEATQVVVDGKTEGGANPATAPTSTGSCTTPGTTTTLTTTASLGTATTTPAGPGAPGVNGMDYNPPTLPCLNILTPQSDDGDDNNECCDDVAEGNEIAGGAEDEATPADPPTYPSADDNLPGTRALTARHSRLPQVILQVLPSTPTPLQHHNLLLATDVHRECCMTFSVPLFHFFFSESSSFFLISNFAVARYFYFETFFFSDSNRVIL